MYMDVRIPTPINSNPGMVLPPRKFTTVHDVARFAAQLIDGLMHYKDYFDKYIFYHFFLQFAKRVSPLKFLSSFFFSDEMQQDRAASREKNQPLCMAQYHRLLGSCRRPGDPRDSQYLPEPRNHQHVIIICRNQVSIFLNIVL